MSSSRLILTAIAAAFALQIPAWAAEDLAALEVVGRRGQSSDQARRDRYECHNWAVSETGDSPVAAPGTDAQPDERSLKRERIDRAIAGAAIGAGVGGILSGGRHRDSDRVLAGAAAGAAIGAATAGKRERARDEAEPSDYLRALTACLEGRGYSVRMPSAADFAVTRSR
jgi:hypothetical protein